MNIWHDADIERFFEAVLTLKDIEDCRLFLRIYAP